MMDHDPALNLDDEFKYSDLPDSKTHIRLLQVHQATEGSSPECELSIWPIESAPPYNAMSYTWGDPNSNAKIKVNGKPITVRANCAYVLLQAYWYNRNQPIWIDALCINQNYMAEKSTQVAIMGYIYASAEKVLACVGRHADNSKVLMRTFRRNQNFYTLLSKREYTYQKFDPDDDRYYSYMPIELEGPVSRWLLRYSLFTARGKKLLQAHNRFFARPYFSRLWVVQEVLWVERLFSAAAQTKSSLICLQGISGLLVQPRSWPSSISPKRKFLGVTVDS